MLNVLLQIGMEMENVMLVIIMLSVTLMEVTAGVSNFFLTFRRSFILMDDDACHLIVHFLKHFFSVFC